MSIKIPIVSDFDARGVERAIKEFQTLETNGQRAQFALRKAALPAAAAVAGLAAGLGVAAKAAIEDQQAQELLARQLRASVGANQAVINSNEDFIKQLSMSAGVADDVLRPAMARLVTGTKDVGVAQQNLSRALDISAATGADTSKVADALSKAYGGNMRALAQLSPEVRAMVKDGASLTDVLAVLDRNFKGAADTAANTTAGKFRVLKVRLDETKESIGAALIPAIDAALPLLNLMAGVVEKNAPLFTGLAVAIGGFSLAILAANAAIKGWRAISVITTAVNYALATSFTAVQVATGIGIATAIAGAAAFVGIKKAMDDAKNSALQYAGATGYVVETQKQLNEFQGPVASRNLEELRAFNLKYQMSLIETGTQTDKVKSKTEDLAKALRTSFKEAMDDANKRLADARKELADYSTSVSKTIEGNVNFGAISEAGAETGTSFLKGLEGQTKQVAQFGELVNRLIAGGLNEQAVQQVIAAGSSVGSRIANEILTTADGILRVNKLTEQLQTVATLAGNNAATAFKQAGVTQGQALVDGIKSIVDKYRIKLSSKGLNEKQLKRLSNRFAIDVEFAMSSGIPALADGGMVTGPTLALIGEAGPEAVVPLDRMGGMGNVTINVNGGDPEAVVNALRRYMNRYGNIPIRTTAP